MPVIGWAGWSLEQGRKGWLGCEMDVQILSWTIRKHDACWISVGGLVDGFHGHFTGICTHRD